MNRTCQNPECGKVLERKHRERQKDWDKRKCCDARCEKARRKAEMYALLETRTNCEVCGCKITPRIDSRNRVKAPRTCRTQACMGELRRRSWEAKMADQRGPSRQPAQTWTDPVGNEHTLPSSIALREEYKASIKRRIKRGEGVAMIGNVRVYEGPVTRAAA